MKRGLKAILVTAAAVILLFVLLHSVAGVYLGLSNFSYYKDLGRMGIIMDWDSGSGSVQISEVLRGSAAFAAGLRKGDLVHSINGVRPGEDNAFSSELWGSSEAGKTVTLDITRGAAAMKITVNKRIVPLIERISGLLHGAIPPAFMVVFALSGLWILFSRRDMIAVLAALVCASSACFVFASGQISYYGYSPVFDVYMKTGVALVYGAAALPFFWLTLFGIYPEKNILKGKKTRLFYFSLAALLPAAHLVAYLAGLRISEMGNLLYHITVPVSAALILYGGVLIPAAAGGRITNTRRRRQFRLMIYGVRFGFTSLLSGYAVISLADLMMKDLSYFYMWTVLPFYLLFQTGGLVIAYTLTSVMRKKKLLETESGLKRGVTYAGAMLIFGILYIVLIHFIALSLIEAVGMNDESMRVFTAVTVTLIFLMPVRRVSARIKNAVYPENNLYMNALNDLTSRLASYGSVDAILRGVENWFSAVMGINMAAMAFDPATGFGSALPDGLAPPAEVMQRLKSGKSFYWEEDEERLQEFLDRNQRIWLKNNRISMTVPLIHGGEFVGVMNFAKKARDSEYTGGDLALIRGISQNVAEAVNFTGLKTEQSQKKRMEREMELAGMIQGRLLPPEVPEVEGLEIFTRMVPCHEVAGDYYDVISRGNGKTVFVVADVSGKGAGAAMVMSHLHASIHAMIELGLPLRQWCVKLNNIVFEHSLPSQFITLILAEWDERKSTLEYINAGHNPPFIFDEDGVRHEMEPTGILLGAFKDTGYKSETVKLKTGDTAVFYTDGLEEVFDRSGEMFGGDRLRKYFEGKHREDMKSLSAGLWDRVNRFSGYAAPEDDQSLLMIRVR